MVKRSLYPEPGSNRHGLLHWCLRPARLPIPPSGPFDLVNSEIGCKGTTKNANTQIFLGKNAFLYKKSAYVLHLATVALWELAFFAPSKKVKAASEGTTVLQIVRA